MKTIYAMLDSAEIEKYAVMALRISLAVIFIWFGLLKVFGFNPVYDLVYFSLVPWFADGLGLLTLGIIESVIGLMLIVNKFPVATNLVVFFHLLGTLSTFLFGWHIVFDPAFPILSLEGEFVVKNLTLAMSGLVVLVYEYKRRTKVNI